MVASRRSLSLSTSGASRFNWSTVPASGARASTEQIGQRRGAVVQRGDRRRRWDHGPADNPVISCSSWSIAPENSSPSLDRVSSTVRRSSINCSMTWLLSASEFVNDDVLENSDSRVPPWPCRIWISEVVSALTSCGFRPWITGLRPPSSRSRSSAGAVRSTGICEPAGRIFVESGAVDEFQIAIADQVEVAHRRLGAGGQHDVAVGVERDQDRPVVRAARRPSRCRPECRRPARCPPTSAATRR